MEKVRKWIVVCLIDPICMPEDTVCTILPLNKVLMNLLRYSHLNCTSLVHLRTMPKISEGQGITGKLVVGDETYGKTEGL